MSNTERNQPLAQEFTLFSLLRFSAPAIAMMLFMGLYTMTDTVFVSRFAGTDALSGVNIVCPVINIIVGLGTMAATGGSALTAKKMGEGKEERARQDFTLIVSACFGMGVLISVSGLFFLDDIIWKLGASQILYPYCKDYLLVIFVFTPASMLQVLYQSFIVAAGKPGFGLVLSAGAGIVNIILDYIFMVPLDMGVTGAALGTGIGYVLPAVAGSLFFCNRKNTLHFTKPVPDAGVLKKTCSNGVSEMISQASTAVTTFFFNLTMMELSGEKGVAAVTIMIYTQFMMTVIYIGFSMGAAPVISYNYGAGNNLRLRKIIRNSVTFIVISSVIVFLTAFLGNRQLVQLFAARETEVYQITTRGFQIFAFSFLFSGMNIFSSAAFTAVSNGKASAVISFLRTFVFLMVGLILLPRITGETGVWLAVPIAEGLTFAVVIYLLYNSNKTRICGKLREESAYGSS